MTKIALSFIIPTYNEEKLLPVALTSITKFVPEELSYQIIIADNGSRDNTIIVARSFGAQVLVDEDATVGGLRNRAVKLAEGRVLVFLDADVSLTQSWGENITSAFSSLTVNPWQVTGSKCGLPEKPGWIEHYWFKPLLSNKVKYINSGHLITSIDLFNKIEGFDERLESGEDYAFGKSAITLQAEIVNNPSLVVVHEGYPKTLPQFIRREIWHGMGEGKSLRTIKTSNVAIASILFAGLHILTALGFLCFSGGAFGLIGVTLIVVICVFFALIKHKVKTIQSVMIVSSLYYIYLMSRFVACLPYISTKSNKHG